MVAWSSQWYVELEHRACRFQADGGEVGGMFGSALSPNPQRFTLSYSSSVDAAQSSVRRPYTP